MIKSDLILFFQNINNLTSFERKKKIYDLTNELDIYLLKDLKAEFNTFFISELQEISRKHRKNESLSDDLNKSATAISEDELPLYENIQFLDYNLDEPDFPSLSDELDDFLSSNDYHLAEDLIENTFEFVEELKELIARGKKLPKNLILLNNSEKDEIIDLSDTMISSKIIYLKKLGIIDFLRKEKPFNTSVNSLATVLSAINGNKPGTIQSLINPILSKNVMQNNNPLNSINSVNAVENTLTKIGFNFQKQNK